ncbi:hypothetical protein D7252_02465 [Microbacterium sp. CGR2]|nr:hypothetical protein D7252_02465 [Microbacterium sp. CGR2]
MAVESQLQSGFELDRVKRGEMGHVHVEVRQHVCLVRFAPLIGEDAVLVVVEEATLPVPRLRVVIPGPARH